MIHRSRRSHGLTLLTLLAVQSAAMPLGACATEREHHEDVAHKVSAMDHAHGSDATKGMTPVTADESHHTPDSAPADCLSLSACGAPAIGAPMATTQVGGNDHVKRPTLRASQGPADIVLGLTTPPPKIWSFVGISG